MANAANITSISTTLGPSGPGHDGQWIYFFGSGFSLALNPVIAFGVTPITDFKVYSDTQLGFYLPAGQSGTHQFGIHNDDDLQDVFSDNYTVGNPASAPTVTQQWPHPDYATNHWTYLYGTNFIYGRGDASAHTLAYIHTGPTTFNVVNCFVYSPTHLGFDDLDLYTGAALVPSIPGDSNDYLHTPYGFVAIRSNPYGA
jgi:hypothetical protein